MSEVYYFLSRVELKPSFTGGKCSLLHSVFSVSQWHCGKVDGSIPGRSACRLIRDQWGMEGCSREEGGGREEAGREAVVGLWPGSCVLPAARLPPHRDLVSAEAADSSSPVPPSLHPSIALIVNVMYLTFWDAGGLEQRERERY